MKSKKIQYEINLLIFPIICIIIFNNYFLFNFVIFTNLIIDWLIKTLFGITKQKF